MGKRKKIKRKFKADIIAIFIFILGIAGLSGYSSHLMPALKYTAEILTEALFNDPLISGNVIRVADGDTITILDSDRMEKKIRLYGIDAPEISQRHGVESRQRLMNLISGKTVKAEIADIDKYGRSVAVIYVEDTNINEIMLSEGHAWYYDAYCKKSFCTKWSAIQDDARRNKNGLWKNINPLPPWEYRKK